MIQGVSFASVAPMLVIGREFGLTAIFGAVIVAGLIGFLISPYFSKLIRFFPPVVTGTIITLIGISLLPVAVRWAGGGNPNSADFASLHNLGLAIITLAIVVLVYRVFKGFISNLSILIGLMGGTMGRTLWAIPILVPLVTLTGSASCHHCILASHGLNGPPFCPC